MKKQIKAVIDIFITYLLVQFAPLLLVRFAPAISSNISVAELSIYSTIVAFIIGAIVMLYISKHFRMTNAIEKKTSSPLLKTIGYGILGLFLSVIGQYLATIIEVNWLGESLTSANTQSLLEIAKAYPLFILVITFVGPIMEEHVFRKSIFGPLYQHIGGIGAAVISSLLFAFLHLDGHILLYSIIGFAFCYVYYKTGSIIAPIISHMLMNLLSILPLFFHN